MSAVLAALFQDHATAERVRTQLVNEGFPTDRVDLTSREEPGQAGMGPADTFGARLEDHFRQLFDRDEEQRLAASLAQKVRRGHAAIVVHPRGEIETQRACEILERAGPVELREHDLEDQTLEYAASRSDTPLVRKVLLGESSRR